MPTALITGAAKRIGYTMASALAHKGWDLILHYHSNQSRCEKLQKEIIDSGQQCTLIQADLTQTKETLNFINEISKYTDQLSLLINNASVFKATELDSETLEDFDQHMHIHFKTPYLLSKQLAPILKDGLIVNMIDAMCFSHTDAYFSYSLSKQCLSNLNQLLAKHLAPQNIRVNAISPGFIIEPEVPFTDNEKQKKMRQIPLSKKGSPEEIIKALFYLIDATFVTGENLHVDGGEHL